MSGTQAVLESHINARGCDFFCRRLGMGPATIVVHGGMVLDGSNFLPHIAPMAEFLDLMVYDQCGRGRSTEREGQDLSKASIWDEVEDLEALRHAIGAKKVHIIGHSWGGIIAGLYASRYPRNVGKLVMIAPVGARYATWQKPWIANTISMLPEKDRAEFEAVLKDRALRKRDPQAYFQRYFSSIHKAWFGDQGWASKVPVHKVRAITGLAVWDSLKDYDVRKDLAKISCPTLIVQGDRDAIPIGSTMEIRDQIPGARLEVVKGVGHYPFIERSEEFAAIVRSFISGEGGQH